MQPSSSPSSQSSVAANKKQKSNPLVNEEQQQEILAANNNKPSVAALVRKETIALSKFHRWTPQDDLLLKNAVEKGLHEDDIQRQVKFSSKFSKEEIKERWRALLYEPGVAELAAKHMVILSNTNTKRVPWTEEENRIIIDELKRRKFISFQHLIDSNRERLHPSRTVKSLEAHFYRLKRNGAFDDIDHYHGLSKKDETAMLQIKESPESLTDVEREIMNSNEIIKQGRTGASSRSSSTTGMTRQTKMQEKKEAKQVTKLEKSHALNAPKVIAKKKRSREEFEEEETVYATLEGEKAKLFIKSEKVVIGRTNKHMPVDLDVSLEGNAGKVSRQQAIIQLLAINQKGSLTSVSTGKAATNEQEKKVHVSVKETLTMVPQWQIQNIGKRDLYVNGERVATNSSHMLTQGNMIAFPGELKFLFQVNQGETDRWIQKQNTLKSE